MTRPCTPLLRRLNREGAEISFDATAFIPGSTCLTDRKLARRLPIRDLLIFVGVIAALLIGLVVAVSKMPNANPLKRILTALCYRLAATLAAGAVAIPLEPIPEIDLLYDIGVPIVLIWYWFTFFRDARRTTSDPSTPVERQATYSGR